MLEEDWLKAGVPPSRARFAVARARLDEAVHCWTLAENHRVCSWTCSVGGVGIRWEWPAAQPAPPVPRAMAHLPEARAVDWTVRIWDDTLAPERLPALDWGIRHGQHNNRVPLLCAEGLDSLVEDWLGAHAWLDSPSREGWVCYRDMASLPRYEQVSPVRGLLHGILSRAGIQMVHASAFAGQGGGVLLAGPSGCGKSSTALRALERGYRYLSDDLCAVAADPEAPRIASQYNAAKLRASNLRAFPGWEPRVVHYPEGDEISAACFLSPIFPERLAAEAPLRAILLPNLTGRSRTDLRPAGIRDVLAGILPWTIQQLPGAGHEVVRHLFHGLARVPAYHLDLGTDPDGIFAALMPWTGPPPHAPMTP